MSKKDSPFQHLPQYKRLQDKATSLGLNPDNLEFFSMNITYDKLRDQVRIPTAAQRKVEMVLEHIRGGVSPFTLKTETLPLLQELIAKYPDMPVLYNYLCVVYQQLGKIQEVKALLKEQYKKNPDYIMGVINYAHSLLQEKDFEKIAEIFNDTYILPHLFPKRREFHITEVVAFYTFMAIYQNALGHRKAAEAWLETVSGLEPEHPEVLHAAQVLKLNPIQRILKARSKKNNDADKESDDGRFPLLLPKKYDPEQDLIEEIEPHLPIPCTLTPAACALVKKQGIMLNPKTEIQITRVLNSGNEGGVMCTVEAPIESLTKRALAISITHVVVSPKHPQASIIKQYQKERIRQLAREHRRG
jgi:tetratricopeptide (TPR) repeat protein